MYLVLMLLVVFGAYGLAMLLATLGPLGWLGVAILVGLLWLLAVKLDRGSHGV